ncbi:MAG: AIM24 family protein [Sarcina sp.]
MSNLRYEITGHDMQMVEIHLEPNQSVIAEAGSMLMMEDNISTNTIFGDGSKTHGGLFGSLVDAGKRALTGTGLFMTLYKNEDFNDRKLILAPPSISKIIELDLERYNGNVICHKEAFICAEQGTKIDISFVKRFGAGLFAGEGFILQSMKGNGMAFVHACGNVFKKDLAAGESIKVDSGSLVAMTNGIRYDIEYIRGIRNKLFGDEGIFFMRLQGPGTVWLQTLPMYKLAATINMYNDDGKSN